MNRFKSNIRYKILLLLIFTALLSFLAFGVITFSNNKKIYDKAIKYNKNTGETTAQITENFAVKQAKKHLLELATEKSRRMEFGINEMLHDSISIANQITQILTHPEKYKTSNLPNHYEKTIYSGEPYFHFAREVAKNEISDELKNEIAITSNIEDTLRMIAKFYEGYQTSFYIGSKNGYLICIDNLPNKQDKVIFNDKFDETFDPRERPWYKEVEKKKQPHLTDYYSDYEGFIAINCGAPYYDSKGFAGVAAISARLDTLYQQIAKDSLGNANINIAVNEDGEVILSSTNIGTLAVVNGYKDLRNDTNKRLAQEVSKMVEGKSDVVQIDIDGKDYYLAYVPMKSIGWSFGTLIEVNEVIKPANEIKETVLTQSKSFETSLQAYYLKYFNLIIISLFIILIALLLINIKFSKRFVTPIIDLTNTVKDIAKGDLEKKLSIKTGDEIEVLADSVNNMTNELKEYMENLSRVTAEKERIATELNVAHKIQAAMLPNVEPDFSNKKEFDLAVNMTPAKEVGGDFYDFYMLDENHLAITVADVSGKGVGAALFMAISKSILRNNAKLASSAYSEGREPDLASIIVQTNLQFIENNDEAMFVTLLFGILDLRNGEFVYVNAGHKTPLVRHKEDGEFSFVRNVKKSGIIGFSPIAKYQEYRLKLNPGDALFLYTDGITEAINSKKELFGENRLKSTLDKIKDDSRANEMLSVVFDAVNDFVADAEQYDDITMLGLVYKKAG